MAVDMEMDFSTVTVSVTTIEGTFTAIAQRDFKAESKRLSHDCRVFGITLITPWGPCKFDPAMTMTLAHFFQGGRADLECTLRGENMKLVISSTYQLHPQNVSGWLGSALAVAQREKKPK